MSKDEIRDIVETATHELLADLAMEHIVDSKMIAIYQANGAPKKMSLWYELGDQTIPVQYIRLDIAEQMMKALEMADLEMILCFDGDASCDHSVGVCWCSYHRMRDLMKTALAKYPSIK